jgi:G patch domain and KOW motifs-containing protein
LGTETKAPARNCSQLSGERRSPHGGRTIDTARGSHSSFPSRKPKQENSFKLGPPKLRPSFIPEASHRAEGAEGIDGFEASVHDTAVAQEQATYGLNERIKAAQLGQEDDVAKIKQAHGNGQKQEETDGKEQTSFHSLIDRDLQALKRDLSSLPSEASLEAYEAMPVEAFGEALLRGMGWSEDRGIGRGSIASGAAPVIAEPKRRPHRLGLGAAPPQEAPSSQQMRTVPRRPPEPGERDAADVAAGRHGGRGSRPMSAQSAPGERGVCGGRDNGRDGRLMVGKTMMVVAGRHAGLMCEVRSVEPSDKGRSERVRVRLLPSYESVVVCCIDLGKVEKKHREDKHSERNGKYPKERRDVVDEPGEQRVASDARNRGSDVLRNSYNHGKIRGIRSGFEADSTGGGDGGTGAYEDQDRKQEGAWLVPGIRVKIVDKRREGGRFYLKKGRIIDVQAPTLCDVWIDDLRESVVDVKQSQLETVVPPSVGTPLLVLQGGGKLKGLKGKLLQRSVEAGVAAVQMVDDLSVHKLSLDDVAEWVGGEEGE